MPDRPAGPKPVAEPEAWCPSGTDTVGGSACVFARRSGADREGAPGWAGACRLGPAGHGVEEVAVAAGRAAGPYVPGRLAVREGPLRVAALRRLANLPDVVLVTGTGRDHPAGAGLASWLGDALAVPTVGVTDRPLHARGDPPAARAGAVAPLTLGGVVVGYWVRTRASARPLAVHAAWRTSPETAVEVVLGCVDRARLPEPLRVARHAARTARADAAGAA